MMRTTDQRLEDEGQLVVRAGRTVLSLLEAVVTRVLRLVPTTLSGLGEPSQEKR